MRLLLLHLMFLNLALCVSCSTAQLNHDIDISLLRGDSIENAGLLYESGEFERAKQMYLKFYSARDSKPEVLERLGNIALFENKPKQAENYFSQALKKSSIKIWPFSASLKVRSALTFLRMGNYNQAVKSLQQSAGPISVGPFKQLEAMAAQLKLFETKKPYVIDGPQQSHIKFLMTDPLPVVEVSINNSAPVKFFIDTGAFDIVLDSAFASEIGVQLVSQIVGDYAGSKQATQGLGRAESIKVGEITVHNIPISTLDVTSPVTEIFNRNDIKGILGTGFLMRFLATLDYANGELVLQQTQNIKQDGHKLLQQADDKVKSIPFWLVDTHYIMAKGSINGIGPMLFWVDTGLAGKGFTASQTLLNKAGIGVDWSKSRKTSGAGGEVEVVDISVDKLSLGEPPITVEQTNVPGLAMKDDTMVVKGVLGFKVGGVISHQFFRNYSVTFDFQQMLLHIKAS